MTWDAKPLDWAFTRQRPQVRETLLYQVKAGLAGATRAPPIGRDSSRSSGTALGKGEIYDVPPERHAAHLTALLTGLLVPIVKEFIDRRNIQKKQDYDAKKRQEEKKYEAALDRQSKVIDSQAQLLDNLAAMFWRLWKMVLKVIYYRTLHSLPDRHEVAFQEYDEQSWELMGNMKAEISRAKRLAPREIHERLAKLFERL